MFYFTQIWVLLKHQESFPLTKNGAKLQPFFELGNETHRKNHKKSLIKH